MLYTLFNRYGSRIPTTQLKKKKKTCKFFSAKRSHACIFVLKTIVIPVALSLRANRILYALNTEFSYARSKRFEEIPRN